MKCVCYGMDTINPLHVINCVLSYIFYWFQVATKNLVSPVENLVMLESSVPVNCTHYKIEYLLSHLRLENKIIYYQPNFYSLVSNVMLCIFIFTDNLKLNFIKIFEKKYFQFTNI